MNALALLAIVTLTWTNPTTNTDGSALPATAITGTRIEYGTCVGTAFGAKTGEWTQAGNVATSQSPDLPAGTHCFRAYTRTASAESAASNVAQKALIAPPSPPTSLTASGPLVAYTIVQSRDRVALVAVGSIAPGTACDAAQPVLGKYVIPRAAVTFGGTVRPEVVLGECS